jgi:hypothetical protein
MIWLSVNFDVFILNLLRLCYEKILLLTSVNLRGDYRFQSQANKWQLTSHSSRTKTSSRRNFRFSLKALIGSVPKGDIAFTTERIHSVICFYQKPGTLWTNQQAHLFVAEEGKAR